MEEQRQQSIHRPMVCPQCGNSDLQVTNEVDIQTSGKNYSAGKGCLGYLMFGPLGILCGSCGKGKQTTATNTTVWACHRCGRKFRSPMDLENEITKERESFPKQFAVSMIFVLVIFIALAFLMRNEKEAIRWFYPMEAIIFVIVAIGTIAQHFGKLSQMKNEMETLISEMDRFR